jgi:hypothetical protein
MKFHHQTYQNVLKSVTTSQQFNVEPSLKLPKHQNERYNQLKSESECERACN